MGITLSHPPPRLAGAAARACDPGLMKLPRLLAAIPATTKEIAMRSKGLGPWLLFRNKALLDVLCVTNPSAPNPIVNDT